MSAPTELTERLEERLAFRKAIQDGISRLQHHCIENCILEKFFIDEDVDDIFDVYIQIADKYLKEHE